jgi:hypothetical protein
LPGRRLLAGHRHAHLALGVGDEFAGDVDGEGVVNTAGVVTGNSFRAMGWPSRLASDVPGSTQGVIRTVRDSV